MDYFLPSILGYFVVLNLFVLVVFVSLLHKINKKREIKNQIDTEEFISVATHELKSPMTGIKGYLSMILNGDAGAISPKARKFIKEAIHENDRLIRLIDNLLNVTRIEEGADDFISKDFNLTPLIKEVYGQFKTDILKKNLSFTFELNEGVNDLVYEDRDQIQIVIANLISNAVKYTDRGSITVKLSNPHSWNVRFEIKDTGPGISKVEQKNLFQKFYRANSNIGKQMGTGLGLFISKLIVDKSGGNIGVKSAKKKGSTFWFELPLRK